MNRQLDAAKKTENKRESTYALLIRSEEKSRNLIEMSIYPVLILSAVIAIGQFALHPRHVPAIRLKPALEEKSVRIGLAEI